MFQSVTTVHDIIVPKDTGFAALNLTAERLTELDTTIQKVAKNNPEGTWVYGQRKGKFVVCNYTAWSTTLESFRNQNHACHANLGGIDPKRGYGVFLLNIVRHETWVKKLTAYDETTFEVAKAYYDWIFSPDGPFGIGMQDVAVIRDAETGLILAQIWLDLKEVPYIPVVSSCINSRLFIEHQHMIPRMVHWYNFEGRKDIAFAFLASHQFNKNGDKQFWYGGHSGHNPEENKFSKHFIDYTLNAGYKTAGSQWSIYVNKYYQDKQVSFGTFADFVKKYDNERKKVN